MLTHLRGALHQLIQYKKIRKTSLTKLASCENAMNPGSSQFACFVFYAVILGIIVKNG